MKKLCLLLALMLTLTLAGCGTTKDSMSTNVPPEDLAVKSTTDATATTGATSTTGNRVADKVGTENIQYNLTKATYSDQNVKISYPQINNLSDSAKQQKINALIKSAALEVLKDYKDSLSSLSLSMDYEIKYQGADLLSLEYLGLANVKDAAYPVNVIQTTNIDLETAKQLVIGDVVSTNNSFAEKIKAGYYIAYSSDLDLKAAGVLKDLLDGFSSQDLLEGFKLPRAKFYLTKDSLGVSFEVAHAVGDHMEMETDYKTLGGLLLVKVDSTPIAASSYSFESKDDVQNNLKSKVVINTYHEEPTSLKDKNTLILNGLTKGEFVEIVVDGEIKNFKHVELKWDDKQNTLIETRVIDQFDKLTNQTVVIKTYIPEGIPSEKIKWDTKSGKLFEFIIAENDLNK